MRRVVAGAGYYQPPSYDDGSAAGGDEVVADENEDVGEGAWQEIESDMSLRSWCAPNTADINGTRAELLTH